MFSLSSFPLCTMFEGTHDDRVAGDNTDAIDFVTIASSLLATNGRRALDNTNRLKAVSLVHGRNNSSPPVHLYCAHKAHARRKQANRYRSYKDESIAFVVWEEEHKEPKRTTATSCGWSNGACVRRKFGTHRLAALRLGFRLRKSRYRV